MLQGLQIFAADGSTILDLESRPGKVIGTYTAVGSFSIPISLPEGAVPFAYTLDIGETGGTYAGLLYYNASVGISTTALWGTSCRTIVGGTNTTFHPTKFVYGYF